MVNARRNGAIRAANKISEGSWLGARPQTAKEYGTRNDARGFC